MTDAMALGIFLVIVLGAFSAFLLSPGQRRWAPPDKPDPPPPPASLPHAKVRRR